MKAAFSTIGCPGWSLDDIFSTAKDLGFDGIELRGMENEMHVPSAVPFSRDNINRTKIRLKKLNLQIPCIASSCHIFDTDEGDPDLMEGREYINLARKLGSPYVRVLGDATIGPGRIIDIDAAAGNLVKLAAYAKSRNVAVLVETNGFFANTENAVRLMKTAGSLNIGVIWDVHHPFRFFGEPVATTFERLRPYIKYVHIKDSIVEGKKIRYKMMGHGDVPVAEALSLLMHEGFEGFVSLEWVKRWCFELEDPGIVFPHFINFIKAIK